MEWSCLEPFIDFFIDANISNKRIIYYKRSFLSFIQTTDFVSFVQFANHTVFRSKMNRDGTEFLQSLHLLTRDSLAKYDLNTIQSVQPSFSQVSHCVCNGQQNLSSSLIS